MTRMPCYFHPDQLLFKPAYEWAFGDKMRHSESTKRAESIVRSLKENKDKYELMKPERIQLKAIRDLHNYQLITLYSTAGTLPEGKTVFPSIFPKGSRDYSADPTNIYHAGYYCFDSGTPLNRQVWTAAAWSASNSVEAARRILKGKERVIYSLSRPPGHHASKDKFGGYCYFNNAGLAARVLRPKGRVMIVDIDFHHGNGTQELFYKDDKVFFASIHGDPREYYPFFCGFPSETGAGKGEGYNLNVALSGGTKLKPYRDAIRKHIIPAIHRFDPQFLILSAGFDTYYQDPIGNFDIHTDDFYEIGLEFNKLNLPTIIVQEGGYFTKDLGKNTVSLLSAFV